METGWLHRKRVAELLNLHQVWIIGSLIAGLAFSFPALSQNAPEVNGKETNLEFFEIVFLGRGILNDWESTAPALLHGKPVKIRAFISDSYPTEMQADLEVLIDKLSRVIGLTTSIPVDSIELNVEAVERPCDVQFAARQSDVSHHLTVVIGGSADGCFHLISENASSRDFLSLPVAAVDPDFAPENNIRCASRHIARGDKGDGSTQMAVLLSIDDKWGGIHGARFCLFDRLLSFLGARGRAFGSSAQDEEAWMKACPSMRCSPVNEVAPTTNDLMMTIAMYRFLADRSYASAKNDIEKFLRGLDSP